MCMFTSFFLSFLPSNRRPLARNQKKSPGPRSRCLLTTWLSSGSFKIFPRPVQSNFLSEVLAEDFLHNKPATFYWYNYNKLCKLHSRWLAGGREGFASKNLQPNLVNYKCNIGKIIDCIIKIIDRWKKRASKRARKRTELDVRWQTQHSSAKQ